MNDADREARLAEQLRANLRRRKAQVQARAAAEVDDPPAPPGADEAARPSRG